MEEQMKHIDEWFRDELGGHSEPPPPRVWADLERRLDAERPRRRIAWWWLPALLVLLLAGFYFGSRGWWRPEAANTVAVASGERTAFSDGGSPASGADPVSPALVPGAMVPSSGTVSAATPGQADASVAASSPVPVAAVPPVSPPVVVPQQAHLTDDPATVSAVPAASRPIGATQPGIVAANAVPVPAAGRKKEKHRHLKQRTAMPDDETASISAGNHNGSKRGKDWWEGSHNQVATVLAATPETHDQKDAAHSTPIQTRQQEADRNKKSVSGTVPTLAPSVQLPDRSPQTVVKNSPAMDSAVVAFYASGARLKIRQGIFDVTIDTILPLKSLPVADGVPEEGVPAGADSSRKHRKLSFDYGIKAGFERGLESTTGNKGVVAPYISFPLGKRIAVSFQPALRYGALSGGHYGTGSYYREAGRQIDTFYKFDSSGTTILQYQYVVHQGSDSSTITHVVSRRLLEFELPILLHYSLGNSFSVFGGLMLTFSKVVTLTENRKSFGIQMAQDTLFSPVPLTPAQLNAQFWHSAQPIGSYNPAEYANPSGNPLSLGYMLGISYMLGKKLDLDVSVQQNLSGTSSIPNSGVRNIYTQPYFRIMIGYRLGSRKQ